MSDFIFPSAENFMPGHSIDCVIIGFSEGELKILIHKWKIVDAWGLPGGFILREEDLSTAALRTLKELTGIDLAFMDQFKTFGKVERNRLNAVSIKDMEFDVPDAFIEWFGQRFISTGYLSLVNLHKCELKPNPISDKLEWRPLSALPQLTFDHNEIIDTAIDYLRKKINYIPIGINLLPEKFTMKTLQKLYEAILGRKLDRGNFQRKMLKTGIFIRHEKQLEGGAHKAPYLYSFDKELYDKIVDQGIGFSS